MIKSDLRPILKLKKTSSPIEGFQNDILRPILKLQNNSIVDLFNLYLENYKVALVSKPKELLEQIKKICQKDKSLKNQLIGVTIGMLEDKEFKTYSEHSNEFNKRIIQMITQRLFDNLKTAIS